MKLKLANCARLNSPAGRFDFGASSPTCSCLLPRLFRLVVGLVPFKRPLRRSVESKREFVPVEEALVVLLYFTSPTDAGGTAAGIRGGLQGGAGLFLKMLQSNGDALVCIYGLSADDERIVGPLEL
jgi:hypothetical protein